MTDVNISMDKKLADYYKQIEKGLICPSKERNDIMNSLKHDVADFLEVHPNADMQDIEQRFGTPETFVAEYLANFEEQEIYQEVTKAKKIRKWIILAVAAVIVIAAVGTTIMVLENHKDVARYYYDELIVTQ